MNGQTKPVIGCFAIICVAVLWIFWPSATPVDPRSEIAATYTFLRPNDMTLFKLELLENGVSYSKMFPTGEVFSSIGKGLISAGVVGRGLRSTWSVKQKPEGMREVVIGDGSMGTFVVSGADLIVLPEGVRYQRLSDGGTGEQRSGDARIP